MKTLFTFLCAIICVCCIRMTDSIGAIGAEPDSSQSSDSIQLNVSPFLADFTSDGKILVVEGENQLRLYDPESMRALNTWSFDKDTIVWNILGGSPSFVRTADTSAITIYKLSDNKLKKFFIDEGLRIFIHLSNLYKGLQISDNFLKRLLGYTDLNQYLNERFPEAYSVSQGEFTISQYLMERLGHDFPKIMKALISRGTAETLNSLKSDLVIFYRDSFGNVSLYSERFRDQQGSLIPHQFSHIPKINNPILVKAGPKKEELLVVSNAYELFHVDRELSINRIPTPPAPGYYPIYDLTVQHDPTDHAANLFLLEYRGLWQRRNESEWELKLRPSTDPRIYDLLPDKTGRGVFIAGYNLYNYNSLIYVSPDEKIMPYSISAIYCRALIRDEDGTVWVGTDNGLFFLKQGQQKFIPLQETQSLAIDTILYHADTILFSSVDINRGEETKSLWIIEGDEDPRWLLNANQNITALAKFPIREGDKELAWIGGNNLFAYLDEDFPGKTVDYLKKLQAVFGIDEQNTIRVNGMKSVGNHLFVATDQGFAKLTLRNNELLIQKIILPEQDKFIINNTANILVRKNNQVLLAANGFVFDKSTPRGGSAIWEGSAEVNEFKRIAESAHFVINVLAETATEELLLGGQSPQVYTLKSEEIVPYSKLPHLPGSLKSMIVLNPSKFIILAGIAPPFSLYSVKFDEETDIPIIRDLEVKTTLWNQYKQLPDSQILLLHQDGTLSLFTLRENPTIKKLKTKERIYKFVRSQRDNEGDTIYLLGDQYVWEYIPGDEELKRRLLALPSKATAGSRDKMDFSVDPKGIWLATESGLWRYDFVSPATQESWLPFYEQDGLPSSNIEAVVSLSQTEAVVFTQAGLCRAEKTQAGYWQFVVSENMPGISGTEVRTASLFELDKRLTLALATDEDVSIVHWVGDEWEEQRWSHFDHDSVLLDNNISVLKWNEVTQKLWVGSQEGVTVLPLIVASDGSVEVQEPVVTLTPEKGLPKEAVAGISMSKDGENAWILTQNALSRWKRENNTYRLAHNEPLFLQNAIATKLGPSVDGKPPRILVRDKNLDWSVWNPAAISVHPQITVKEWFFFWYKTQLTINSLDPELENPNLWDEEYRIDRIDIDPLKRSWGWLLDLWKNTGQHYIIASVKLKEDPSIEYRATTPIPRAPSQTYRVARLLGLLVLNCFFIASLILFIRRHRIRTRRLRRQEIPYIQGEAIKDASKFFGRQDLLTKLQNTVPTTNYALVGEFRVGKTSIQFRLRDLLKSLENPKYTFLSIFVDLQLLRVPRKQYFFHFLGTHLLELAQEYKIPDNVVNELHIKQIDRDEDYKSVYLKNDLEALFEYLEKKYPDKPPIILFQIDEITLMNDYDTLLKLRALLIREPRFKVILSGRALYKDPGRDTVSPWWNILQETEVEPLTPSEARKLIVEPVKGLFQFENEAVEHIIARSQGMPLAIQTMCANVLHYKYNAKKFSKRITKDDLYASLDFTKEQKDREEEEQPTPDLTSTASGQASQEGNLPKE